MNITIILWLSTRSVTFMECLWTMGWTLISHAIALDFLVIWDTVPKLRSFGHPWWPHRYVNCDNIDSRALSVMVNRHSAIQFPISTLDSQGSTLRSLVRNVFFNCILCKPRNVSRDDYQETVTYIPVKTGDNDFPSPWSVLASLKKKKNPWW